MKIGVKPSDFKNVSIILITNETPEHFDFSAVENIAKKNNSLVIAHDVDRVGLVV